MEVLAQPRQLVGRTVRCKKTKKKTVSTQQKILHEEGGTWKTTMVEGGKTAPIREKSGH